MEKITVYFVLLLFVSLAMGVDVFYYNYQNYDVTRLEQATVPKPTSLFTFGFKQGDNLTMDVFLKNTEPSMAAVYFIHPLDNNIRKEKFQNYNQEDKTFYRIRQSLQYTNISIEVELNTTSGLCTRKLLAAGKNSTKYNGKCLNTYSCMIEVDLRNIECDVLPLDAEPEPVTPHYGNAKTIAPPNLNETSNEPQPSSESLKAVLTYTIPSAIVMCVLLLVMWIGIKKYCHRNSSPVETTELNTYTNTSEVIYAELALVQEDSRPARPVEESPYAKIIGVLNPKEK